MNLPFLSRTNAGVTLRVRVQPRGSQNRIVGIHDGALKLQVTAPPVDGQANQALISALAHLLGLPRSQFRITSGAKGRSKVVAIAGLTPDDLAGRLADLLSAAASR